MRAAALALLVLAACGGGAKQEPATPAPAPAPAPRSVIEVDAPPEEVPPPEGPAPSSQLAAFETGVPECDDYLVAFERLVTVCADKLGPGVDAVKQALDAQKSAFLGWRDLDDSSRAAVHQAAAAGCKSGADAIKQTATSMGCAL